jgi:uncharacterized protein (TIRG00374 family)
MGPSPSNPLPGSRFLTRVRRLLQRLAPPARFLLRWGLRLLGPALLAYILWANRAQLPDIWKTLRGVSWPPMVLAIVLMGPFVLLKGWRWQVILKDLGQEVPWKKLSFYYMLGIFLGSAMPGQAGDFLKAWYLKEDGHDLGAALLSTVIDRIFDMLIMGLLALSGLYILWQYFPGASLILLLIGMSAAIVLVLSVLLSRRWRNWLIDRVLRYVVPAGVRRVLGERGARAYLDRFFLSWRNVALGTAISLASFSITFYRLWLCLPAIGKSLPLEIFVPTMALMALGSLPSVAGLGTRDGILLLILGPAALGWPRSDVLSLSLLILLFNIENVIVGLPFYLFRPLGTRDLSGK